MKKFLSRIPLLWPIWVGATSSRMAESSVPAWGLVPREHSSGGVQKLGGISKRGDDYLRRMLIQGAWSVINYAEGRQDRLCQWALQVKERRGKHKAVIAVANKLARIIWALVRHETTFCPA